MSQIKGEERPPDATTPALVPQGPKPTGPWRCTRCYATRYKTMYFKLSTGPNCENCGRTQDDAGWSIHLHHDELPPYVQDMVVRQFGPKILRVIRSKFPGAEVDYGEGQEPPSV